MPARLKSASARHRRGLNKSTLVVADERIKKEPDYASVTTDVLRLRQRRRGSHRRAKARLRPLVTVHKLDVVQAVDLANWQSSSATRSVPAPPKYCTDSKPAMAEYGEELGTHIRHPSSGGYTEGWPSEAQADHIAALDRVRILREIDTKRHMLSIHILEPDQACPGCSGGITLAVCPVVCRFALRYPNRPAGPGRPAPARPQQEMAAVAARIRPFGPLGGRRFIVPGVVPRAVGRTSGHAGFMSARVVVYPPSESGGRRVTVDGQHLGIVFSLHDLAVFLERAGLEGWDELDVVVHTELIEWRGGGPDVWER